jgi:hypothetical protein
MLGSRCLYWEWYCSLAQALEKALEELKSSKKALKEQPSKNFSSKSFSAPRKPSKSSVHRFRVQEFSMFVTKP